MSSRHTVAIGDRFIRAGHPQKVFVVIRIDQRPRLPDHARLAAEPPVREDITISLTTLLDSHYFQRAPASPAPSAPV